MVFSGAECPVLQLGDNNPMQQHRLGDEWLESYQDEKGLRLLVDSWLYVSQGLSGLHQK